MNEKDTPIVEFSAFYRKIVEMTLNGLKDLGKEKVGVVNYVIGNMGPDNIYNGTQDGVAEKMGLSPGTVNQAFKGMYRNGFIKRLSNGRYKLNIPNIEGVDEITVIMEDSEISRLLNTYNFINNR